MRIGVMLRHYDQHGGGVRVYTRALLNQLLQQQDGHEYVLYFNSPALLGTYAGNPRVREVSVAGDIAWRTAVVTNKLPNGEVAARGQSLEIWKRVNGEWRLHRQMSANILTLPRLRPGPPPSRPALDAPVQ